MTLRRAFNPSEESVGAARRFVIGAIADAAADVQDSVALMVSELSTNALVHAGGGFAVVVDRSDPTVFVSVSDRGDGTPALQSPGSTEPHGRGLRIVEALSDEWGIADSSHGGKSVWFRVSLRSPDLDGSPGSGDRTAEAGHPGSDEGSTARPVKASTPGSGGRATTSSRRRGPRRQSRTNPQPIHRLRRTRSPH